MFSYLPSPSKIYDYVVSYSNLPKFVISGMVGYLLSGKNSKVAAISAVSGTLESYLNEQGYISDQYLSFVAGGALIASTKQIVMDKKPSTTTLVIGGVTGALYKSSFETKATLATIIATQYNYVVPKIDIADNIITAKNNPYDFSKSMIINSLSFSVVIYNIYNLVFNKALNAAAVTQDENLGKFLATNEIQAKINNVESFNLLLTLVESIYHYKIYATFGMFDQKFLSIKSVDPSTMQSFKNVLVKIAITAIPYCVSKVTLDVVKEAYQQNLNNLMVDDITDKWLDSENALKLTYNNQTTTYLNSYRADILAMLKSSLEIQSNYIKNLSNSLSGFVILKDYDSSLITSKIIVNEILTQITSYLNKKTVVNIEKIEQVEAIINKYIEHIQSNAKLITESKGLQFIQEDLEQRVKEQRELNAEQNLFSNLKEGWGIVHWILNFLISYYQVAVEIYEERITSASVKEGYHSVIQKSLSEILSIFQFESNTINEVEKLNFIKDRLFNLFTELEKELEHRHHEHEVREGESAVIFEDFVIYLPNNRTIEINNLSLEFGKTYSVRGANGSGKSSILRKIDNVKYNGVESSGKIIFSSEEMPKVIYVTQEAYLPIYSSFSSILFYPSRLTSEEKAILEPQAIEWLKELRFNNIPLLSEVRDWKDLSGGEKQKIQIIQAIMQKKIDFLRDSNSHIKYIAEFDESFGQMDEISWKAAQSLVKKNFANDLVLVITHNSVDNNFFDCELEIIAGKLHNYCD